MKRTPPLGPAVRILLLEDDPISVEIVGTYLRRIVFADVELHIAVTVAEALALLAQADVELVVADLHLPDSAGAATVERLVHATDCPVIAITADLDPKLRDATLACGAFEFLQKGDLTEATLMRLVRLATMQARTYRSLRESKEAETALRESEGRFRNLARFGQSAVVKSEPAELVARAAARSSMRFRPMRSPISTPTPARVSYRSAPSLLARPATCNRNRSAAATTIRSCRSWHRAG